MNISKDIVTLKLNNATILYDQSAIASVDANLFAPPAENIEATASGRGNALFFHYQGNHCLLRHYQRGGMVRHFNRDCYWNSGLELSRSYLELQLLLQLFHAGLPVPKPLAIRYLPGFLCYRADIVTQVIEHATTLADFLLQHRMPYNLWQRAGEVIAQLHRFGVYHADLNCRNILLNQQLRFFVIDFDRGTIRPPDPRWQKSNLNRLERSLQKMAQRHIGQFHFQNSDWLALLKGYTDKIERG